MPDRPLVCATIVVAIVLSFIAAPAGAQARRSSPDERASSLRMGDTTIEGERPTPDIFFIVPTGKGGNLQSPHRRDYSSEILAPVVKPWLEKDQNVSLAAIQHVASGKGDWEKALSSVERALPPPAPAPAPLEPIRSAPRPPVEVPQAALSRPPPSLPERPAPAPLPPVRPAPVAAAPPPPPPPAPPPAAAEPPPPSAPRAAPPPESVPILVPPQ